MPTDRWVDDGIALVNANGILGRDLRVGRRVPVGDDVQIEIACKNSSGVLTDTRFIVLATSRH